MSNGISMLSGPETVQSLNMDINSPLPAWDVPSRMAFHIVFDRRLDSSGKLTPVIRRPYLDKSRPYNQYQDFMVHETRQILDDLIPEEARYGIVTFEAGGSNDQRAEMRRTAEYLSRGWSWDGARYRCIYGHVPDDGFMLFVSAHSNIYNLEDLGIIVSSDPKAAKRVRRFFAAHSRMYKGRVVDTMRTDIGTGLAVEFANGVLISVLDYDMNTLDADQRFIKEGSCTCKLPGFDGAMATFGGFIGQGKGVSNHNPRVWMYDVVLYDTKKEVVFTNGAFYLGILAHTGLHSFKMDLQTLTNSGLYEDHLVTKAGLLRMDKLAELYSSDDEDAIIADFAATVRAADAAVTADKPVWPLIRAIHLDHQSKTMPVFMRRMFNHCVQESAEIIRGRVEIKNGFRGYAFPNPLIDAPDGTPLMDEDTIAGWHDGLRQVCAPDAPEGRIAAGRSPNTHSGEITELWNVHIPELMNYKDQGRIFFGKDAAEILGGWNGGDFDDMVFIFWGEEYLAKFRTMKYPVQPRIKHREAIAQSRRGTLNKERWQGIGPRWTPNVFFEQLNEFERGSESLGSFINRGWIDTLLSGEHRIAIRACLDSNRYITPENFQAPSIETLQKLVSPEVLAAAGEYEPTAAGFLKVARAFNDHKQDFVTAMAMSNSDVLIDWLQMKKGSKLIALQLIANSMEALKSPIFPICFASRIPRDRQDAGDYILVETKLCRALAILDARRDQLIEDSRQLEHLIKRPLATALLRQYPLDDEILRIIAQLKYWWRVQFDSARKQCNGGIPTETFRRAAYGYTSLMEVKMPEGKIKLEEIHQPGLLDFYTNQFSVSGTAFSLSGTPWSVETRRKIGVHLANIRYTDDKEPRLDDGGFTMSVSDGILIDPILDDILDAEEELGLTGQVEFINLNAYARKKLVNGDKMLIKAEGGHIFHLSNRRELSQTPNPTIPDGQHLMSSEGIIRVAEAIPELKSNFKSKQVAALAANGFEFDEDPDL